MGRILKKKFESENVDIKVITSNETIKTVLEIFTDEEEQKIFNEITQGQALAVKERTLCYTDWRYPDGNSFVQRWEAV